MRVNRNVDPNKVEPGGREYVAPGKYHVEVTAAGDKTRNNDPDKTFTMVDLTVRNGTNPDQVNRVINATYDHYSKNETAERMAQEMIFLFAVQCGLATREEIADAQKNEKDIVFEWGKAVHKHLVVEIEDQVDKKDANKVYRGKIKHMCVFAVDDPRVHDVPKDKDAVQLADASEMF